MVEDATNLEKTASIRPEQLAEIKREAEDTTAKKLLDLIKKEKQLGEIEEWINSATFFQTRAWIRPSQLDEIKAAGERQRIIIKSKAT